MNDNFPTPITNETDLEFYENYLKDEFVTVENKAETFTDLLKKYIGKPIKADCTIGNRVEYRIGILSSVGMDFIIIKPNRNREIIIKLQSIKFISVLPNNTKLPHY